MNILNYKLLSGVILTMLLIGINACNIAEEDISSKKNIVVKDRIANRSLEQLLKEYRYYLFDDFLPFMDKYVIDSVYGGFMCITDRDGTNISTNKTARFEGRGIFIYSFLYNNIKKDPKYLEIAKKSVEFILKNEPTGDNLWHHKYSREGKPIKPPTDNIYEDLFIANGLAEYSIASGEEKYREKAKKILLKCMRIYDNPDYPCVVKYGPDAEHSIGPRILGHWMIIIRMVTQMLEHKPDKELEIIADKCVDAIMNRHFNPEYKMFNEVINHDYSRPEGPYSQFVYIGHAIETLWMLLYEAERRKDEALFKLVAERFKYHVEIAKDRVYGGVFRSIENVNKNIWKVDKVLWVQEEVMIGCLIIAAHSDDQWAKDTYAEMYEYVIDKYSLEQYGFPLWIIEADRKVTFEEKTNRVGNFHHPRHLMLNILNLEKMIHNRRIAK